jgi:subtilisin family serine protease
LTIEAGPQQQGTADSGGANGRDGLLNALESLAGTANSIVNTLDKIGDQGVLWAAGSSSTSAFTDAVSGLFDSAVTDLSHFTTSFGATFEDFDAEVYELTDDGLRRIFPAREGGIEALDILQSLQKLTHNLANLRNEVILEIKAYWKQGTAAAAALAGTEEALRKFGSFDWTTLKKHARPSTISTSTKTGSSTSSSSSSATPTPFFFMTKYGTALSVFQQYLKTLPDNGQGHQIVYPHVPWQSYFTNLTTKEAQDVASQSFIYFVTAVVPTGNDHDQQVGVPRESGIRKRINENGNLDERLNSDQHLRVLSVANQESLDSNNLPNYLYDPLLGLGQTIYVLDGGFDKDHSDFQPPLDAPNRQVREHVVPNEYTLAREEDRSKWGPESLEDWTGHGTAVASVAAGLRHGVASNADLVLVKYKNVAEQPNGNMQLLKATEPAVSDAWEWIISDVQSRRITGYTGKAVVVMPGGKFLAQPVSGTF